MASLRVSEYDQLQLEVIESAVCLQARYLVERQDLDVYAKVLDPENEHRREVVNQLVNTALPESKHPEMVSVLSCNVAYCLWCSHFLLFQPCRLVRQMFSQDLSVKISQ